MRAERKRGSGLVPEEGQCSDIRERKPYETEKKLLVGEMRGDSLGPMPFRPGEWEIQASVMVRLVRTMYLLFFGFAT